MLQKATQPTIEPIPIKHVEVVNNVPVVKWTEVEVRRITIIEKLQYIVIEKFSYEWPHVKI